MSLSRRSLLAIAGVAALPRAARAELPSAEWTRAALARGAEVGPSGQGVLSADERATIAAIADAILPRTETPGALDVQVPAFIEILAAEWLTDEERSDLHVGIVELDRRANSTHGAAWPALTLAQQQSEIAWAESRVGTASLGQRAFRRLKSWTVHGWVTSERVQREVFRSQLFHQAYYGCAPVAQSEGDR
ncbi:MAG: gluconate 2-dehydrogenase subunit 3 family protein [Gemmatimonadaceae bacterium]|nr:gluconate 2-dehydrogenase subunit 3 family protein [Gemmatimonadaceae bacterium]